jgi:hypothetical protein
MLSSSNVDFSDLPKETKKSKGSMTECETLLGQHYIAAWLMRKDYYLSRQLCATDT